MLFQWNKGEDEDGRGWILDSKQPCTGKTN